MMQIFFKWDVSISRLISKIEWILNFTDVISFLAKSRFCNFIRSCKIQLILDSNKNRDWLLRKRFCDEVWNQFTGNTMALLDFVFIFISLFLGYVFTPIHPCVAYSTEYFKTNFIKVMKVLGKPVFISFIILLSI